MKKGLIRILKYLLIFVCASSISYGMYCLSFNVFKFGFKFSRIFFIIFFVLLSYILNRLFVYKSYKRISNTILPLLVFEGLIIYLISILNKKIFLEFDKYLRLSLILGIYIILDYIVSLLVVYRKSIDSRETDEKEKYYKQSLLFSILKFIVKTVFPKYEVNGIENMPNKPAIYISNHAQAHGPIAMQIYFPTTKSIWCIGEMMDMKSVPSYAYQDFWSLKPKRTKWIFKIISYLIAPLCEYIFRRADALAVYKDARIISTFKDTVTELNEGNNIVIFPESPTLYNDIVNEFQDKFVDVARLYYKKNKEDIQFVPTYVGGNKITFGKPITFDHNISIDEQRESICTYLKEEITKIAKEMPTHKVIPYLNIGKKNYKNNK